ncbi:hypothetical protein BT96DRAFT_1000708 [Gymnopus androsaceus JB14]|uniref:Uncharacterized protein n=1 Tax=Gymnopus androsaceus JB14 TaxID=1447944 RepID=A0A6A4H478_9AGAR|nr:hypothetical protein BT96DRAFT_1000708 [Gymnopus androsaceus JB14]
MNAALPSTKRKLLLPLNSVPDGASTATGQQAEPAGKRTRTEGPNMTDQRIHVKRYYDIHQNFGYLGQCRDTLDQHHPRAALRKKPITRTQGDRLDVTPRCSRAQAHVSSSRMFGAAKRFSEIIRNEGMNGVSQYRPFSGPQPSSQLGYVTTTEQNREDAHSYRYDCHCSGCHTFRLIRERGETEFRNHVLPSCMVEELDTESENDSSTGTDTDLGPSSSPSPQSPPIEDRAFHPPYSAQRYQMSFNATERSPSPDLYTPTLPMRSPFHSSYGSNVAQRSPSTEIYTSTLSAFQSTLDRHGVIHADRERASGPQREAFIDTRWSPLHQTIELQQSMRTSGFH